MKRWLIGAAILAALVMPVQWAWAQLGVVLSTCGSTTMEASQNQARSQTIDLAGRLCVMAGTIGSSNLNPGQVSVGTTATQIIPSRAGRRAVTIINEGTTDVRFGNSNVTTGNGALLSGTKGSTVTLPVSTAIYGIVGTGTQSVSYVETW
jgi:hypothetical protein